MADIENVFEKGVDYSDRFIEKYWEERMELGGIVLEKDCLLHISAKMYISLLIFNY